MDKKLIIGLDLSMNSTGISCSYLEDFDGKSLNLHRILFDDGMGKVKLKKPNTIKNVNDIIYRMPTNISVDDMMLDGIDKNTEGQLKGTLRAMIASKKICEIISNNVKKFVPNKLIITIENYVMPTHGGKTSLPRVSELISLQNFVRKFCIELAVTNGIQLKMYTPTPGQNKVFFASNGNAEKYDMLKSFLENFEGNKILPTVTMEHLAIIDDVVDSFSLMMNGYSKIISNKF